jgi:hypothetical protein
MVVPIFDADNYQQRVALTGFGCRLGRRLE